MAGSLESALGQVRAALLDTETLVRAVAAGRRRGQPAPDPERVELRPVDLKAGPAVQVVRRRATEPRVATSNVPVGDPAALSAELDGLLALPFGNWHVETTERTVQLRVTKKGDALLHEHRSASPGVQPRASGGTRSHDRVKDRLIDPDDPLFTVLGADADKRRQVDAFLRMLATVLDRAERAGVLTEGPLRTVDLGCGNAYLTLAAHRYLAARRPGSTSLGVELRDDLVERSRRRAVEAGLEGLDFSVGKIAEIPWPATVLGGAIEGGRTDGPDVVLALHACDTATDEALARAVQWQAPVVLAAPCCHHDVQRQLSAQGGAPGPYPYGTLTRHAILRERFADVLTDAVRAQLLRLVGYRVEVVEFVDSRHTPRNAMVRAVRTGAAPTRAQVDEYRDLVSQWGIRPALEQMLRSELALLLGSEAPAAPTGTPAAPHAG